MGTTADPMEFGAAARPGRVGGRPVGSHRGGRAPVRLTRRGRVVAALAPLLLLLSLAAVLVW